MAIDGSDRFKGTIPAKVLILAIPTAIGDGRGILPQRAAAATLRDSVLPVPSPPGPPKHSLKNLAMPFVTVHGRKLDTMLIPGSSPGSIPGASDAPCLVFLHEGLGSIGLWRRFPGQVAAATGCPALVWSRQGYGRSDPPAASRGLDYLHIEALEMLPGLLDALDIHDPILIGHSDGASIALLHAGLANRPVRGIVLEAPHVFVEDIT